MKFLPDTNALISYFEGKEPDKNFLTELIAKEELFISPVVVAELRPRTNTDDQKKLNDLIGSGTVIPIDLEIGFMAGQYREQFSKKTKKVYLLDCLIAATCKAHDLALITNNLKDYPMKDIKIIKP